MSDERLTMNETYLIVGGTSGVGRHVAEVMAQRDARVHILSRGSKEVADVPGTVTHRCDVVDEASPLPHIEGPLHGLAYMPGTITLKPFHLLRQRNLMEDLQVNYLGAVRVIQHYLKNLKEAEEASVVLMSTVAVQTGLPYHASIAGAKGAVEGLTRSLAAELAPGIRVNAVAPSLTDTPLASTLLNQPAKRQTAAERHPLKRVGMPQEIGDLVSFLLTGRSGWMTGQVLHADGGLSAVRLL